MFSYHNTRRLSPPRGRILVEATPSNSDGSQSQPSQPFDQFQGHGRQAAYGETQKAIEGDDVASQRSTQSSYPSSSYERLLNGERDPDEDVRELQATQPCTQESTDMAGGLDDTQPENIVQSRATGTNTTTTHSMAPTESTSTNTHPRSLLSTVNPNLKWRYEKFQDNAPGPAQHGAQNPAASRQGAHAAISLQETQAVSEDESTQPPRRQFPKPTRSTAFSSTANTHGGAPTLNNDQMDIVPDSEPLRGDSTSKTRGAARSPSKKLIRLNSDSSDAIPSSGEIVSDSMVVDGHEGRATSDRHGKQRDYDAQQLQSETEQEIDDDDDDDVPLAVVSSKKAKAPRSDRPTHKV
jgi:hypothetical protein